MTNWGGASKSPIGSAQITDGSVAVADLAAGIPQSLSSGGSSTKAVADTTLHVVGGPPIWDGSGWVGLGGAPTARDYYMNGANANMAESFPRDYGTFNATGTLGTTGVMTSTAIMLWKGMVITSLTFRSGTTAGSAMTHWWVALYDTQATPALIAQSADQTNGAIAASTVITVALASPAPYTVVTTGIHYVAIMVAAGTIPTLTGSSGPTADSSGVIATGQKIITQTSGSGLTTTAPGTIATPTAVAARPYFATT